MTSPLPPATGPDIAAVGEQAQALSGEKQPNASRHLNPEQFKGLDDLMPGEGAGEAAGGGELADLAILAA